MADSYHQLSIVAQERGAYDEALTWYRKALAIFEELGNRAGMASTISQIGVLHTQSGAPEAAVPFNLRSLALRLELQVPEVPIDLHWLSRQREALGEARFRALAAEHAGEEGAGQVIALLERAAAAGG